MSYKIGQFRKDMENNYLTPLNMVSQPILTSSSNIIGDIKFQDIALSIENSNFSYQKNYYVQIQIARTSLDQIFTVSLSNVDEYGNISSFEQYLKTFYIPAFQQHNNNNNNNNTAVLDIVFNPNINFNSIIVKLNRTLKDYSIENENGSTGRVFEIENVYCYEIKDILNNLGISEIVKLGVQGRPGLLMCINGQQIRIGPSGIYEIKNGYRITSIGFVIENNNSTDDYFILDYQYEGR